MVTLSNICNNNKCFAIFSIQAYIVIVLNDRLGTNINGGKSISYMRWHTNREALNVYIETIV